MASLSDGNDQNDVASTPPRTEETPAATRQRFTPTGQTQPSLPSSSNPRMPSSGNSVHAPPLPTLPFEIIAEILSKLPVKFLLQLRCICKSWKTLISDPQFAKKHLHNSPKTMHLILTSINSSHEFVVWSDPLPSVFNAVTITGKQLRYPLKYRKHFDFIAGSCNGILCFAIDRNNSLLWNPSIGKFKSLPSLHYPYRNFKNPYPMNSYTVFGFGYDPVADKYKVVAIYCYVCSSDSSRTTSDYKTEVKIYTLGTDYYWRRIEDFPSGVPLNESGKFVNGTVNWLASIPSSSVSVIVSLDLGKESYQELLLPDNGGVFVRPTLAVLRDCLCILSRSAMSSDVWLMKEYGNRESWTKLFTVHLGDPNTIHFTRALYMYEDDQVLLEYQSHVVVYESRNGNYRILQFDDTSGWAFTEVYSESLISPCF